MTITFNTTRLTIAILTAVILIPTTALAAHTFGDVPDGQFYSDPVEWAFDNGITTGTSATTFAPDDTVTRGENVTFAFRYDKNVVQPALAALATDVGDLAAKLHWAAVNSDGSLSHSSSGSITSTRTSTGIYEVTTGVDVSQCSFIAGLSNTGAAPSDGIIMAVASLSDPMSLIVITEDFADTRINNDFHVQIMC